MKHRKDYFRALGEVQNNQTTRAETTETLQISQVYPTRQRRLTINCPIIEG